MRSPRARYQIWQVMLAIAVLAGLFAIFGVFEAVVAGVILSPIFLAAPGRRLAAAVWVASIYPALIVASFYATWVTAWCVLGHRPRVSLDDPKYISPIVDGVAAVPSILFEVGVPLIWFVLAPIVLAVVGWDLAKKEAPARRGDLSFILIPIGTWLFAYVFLLCDPGRVVEWYLD